MRFSRMQGTLTAAALLALAPVYSHAAPAPAAPAPTSPSLTPPGSSTSVPLLPSPAAPGQSTLTPPAFTFPPTSLNTPGTTSNPGATAAIPPVPLPSAGAGFGAFPAPSLGDSSGMGTSDLSSVLSGSSALPLSMTLGQLDSHWYRMTITGSSDLGNLMQSLTPLPSSPGLNVYYTKGKTVSIGASTYLVTYRAPMQNVGPMSIMFQEASANAKPPHATAMTAQTPLALSLVNLQTAGSLTDIRAFDLSRELADSAAAVHAYNSLMDSFGMAGKPSRH